MKKDNKRKRIILIALILIISSLLLILLGIIFFNKDKDRDNNSSSSKGNEIYNNLFSYSDELVKRDLYPIEGYKSKKIISLNYINKTMEYGLLSSNDNKDILINIRFNNLDDDVFTNINNNDFSSFNNYNLDVYDTFVDNTTHFIDYNYKYFLKSELNSDKTYFYGLKYDDHYFYSISNQDIDNIDINEVKINESQKDYFDLLKYLFTPTSGNN